MQPAVTHDLEVVYRDPAKLKPYARNSRKHPPEQVAAIRRNMERIGNYSPILLRDDDESIGAGHGRQLAALLDPPLKRVPTITLRGLSDQQWRELIIWDNKSQDLSEFDEAILKLELQDLMNLGADLSVTGFADLELSNLFSTRKGRTDPDQLPPISNVAVSRLGDLWTLGRHRIVCGDATDAALVQRLLTGAKPELCLTDPPYGIGFGYAEHDDSSNDENAKLVGKVFALAPKAKAWTPGLMNLARDITRFGEAKVLCWHKGFAAAGNGLGGASTWEPVLVVGPKHKRLANDYLEFKTDREELAGRSLRDHHPCPKPVALFAHLAEALCSPKGAIYEPFSGSGTTLIACEMALRTCLAVEISPIYVDVAIRRWEAFTGLAAQHESGATFEQLAAERLEVV